MSYIQEIESDFGGDRSPAGFQTLSQNLNFIKQPTAPLFIARRGIPHFQFDGATYVSQSLKQDVSFVVGQVDMNQFVQHNVAFDTR